ncbi:unnamed protein product [Blepharisma stoltei]|uniref:SH3 domain-containing protein n=1 Tax=Blepharisma stoltei TaxID=1481888 RepID=A0AAU9JTF2_9CILI|nr:unnamed protein product [Blepharisma stoltei]
MYEIRLMTVDLIKSYNMENKFLKAITPDPESHKLKVQALLTAFQGSLFSHLMSVASNRQESTSYLGHFPFSVEVTPVEFQEISRSTPVDFQEVSRSSSIKGSQFQNISRRSPLEKQNTSQLSSRSSQFKEISWEVNTRSSKQLKELSRPESSRNSGKKEISTEFLEQASDEEFVTSFGQGSEIAQTPKRGEIVQEVQSAKNDIENYMEKCKGIIKKPPVIKEEYEFEFEETDPEKLAKVLARKNIGTNNIDHPDFKPKPARFIIPEDLPEHIASPPKQNTATLYGEVIATTYSQGGDGFALHPGDLVTILQFLTDFGLAECRWQGMQGLFPQDKIKVLTKPDQSLNSSLVSLAQRQLFNLGKSDTSFQQSGKLLSRLAKNK